MTLNRFLFLIIFFGSFLSHGQGFKKEHRIYMLDITKSMWGLDNPKLKIFDDVKEELYKGIQEIKDPETTITVIPFQATHTYENLESWTFRVDDKKTFNEMKKSIDTYSLKTVPGGYTDIYSALEKAKTNLDPQRINYVFLLTDGEQSAVPSSPTKINRVDFDINDLKRSLNNWCTYSTGKDVHLFYAMLTDVAVDQSLINIIEEQCNAYVTKGTNFNIAFIKPRISEVRLNLHENPKVLAIPLEANDWSYIKDEVEIRGHLNDNELFELVEGSIRIDKLSKTLSFSLKTKDNISFERLRENSPIESKLRFSLITKDDVKILNPIIDVVVRNKKERILNLRFSDAE